MKIKYMGILKDVSSIPENDLPSDAVKFKEPKNIGVLYLFSLGITFLLLFLVYLFSTHILCRENVKYFDIGGLLLFVLSIIPHELLHAMCYPKNSVVYMYCMPSKMCFFVYSKSSLSKNRFIFMSILPSLVFTFITFIVWCVYPISNSVSDSLIGLVSYSIIGSSGDVLNIINALLQMPANSYTKLSGFSSYWFLKDEKC